METISLVNLSDVCDKVVRCLVGAQRTLGKASHVTKKRLFKNRNRACS